MPDRNHDFDSLLHLTPRGWFQGEAPCDRVLTLRRSEAIEEVWRHDDEALVRETLSKYGAVPE